MAIDWSDIEDALHTWLETAMAAVDVDADRIIWSDQDAPRGEGPYLTVRRGDLIAIAPPIVREVDRTEFEPPEDIAAGEEIEQRSEQTFALTISLQAFDARTVGDVTGAVLLQEALMYLSLPTVQDALEAAGLFLFDQGGIRNVTELVGADMESRAVADVRFYLNDSRSLRTGYIATVELTPTVDGVELDTITLAAPEE